MKLQNRICKILILSKLKYWCLTLPVALLLIKSSTVTMPACPSALWLREPPQYKGRTIAPVMSAAGANWLKRDERKRMELPDKVVDALGLQPGMTVADVGAGIGYFSWRMAKQVGAEGRVLAVDIQIEMLEGLKMELRKRHIKNVEAVLGTSTNPRLPPNSVDLALLVDVYHEFQHPEAMISKIRDSLKKDGRMVLVEYRGEDPTVPIRSVHKMTTAQVLTEILPMGFQLKKKLEFLPWQHIFIFKKKLTSQITE